MPLALEEEKDFAEILLASQDMMHVLQFLGELPADDSGDTPRTILAATQIVTAYCRPFTRNSRGKIIGKRWIITYDEREMTLHRKALRVRNRDLAHTETYDGRVQIQIQNVPDDGSDITFSPITLFAGFTRAEYQMLWIMVGKLREVLEAEKQHAAQSILRARVAAGYRERFTLGET